MIDQDKIKQAVTLFLEAIGEDPDRPGLVETPDRIAKMSNELFSGLESSCKEILSKRFAVENSEMVLEKDIQFYSVCEHHLLPFFGKVHIAYIPDGEVVGISKLARTVEVFARRPQIQEHMTCQIADALMDELSAKGVMVMVEAEHLCMSMRGIKKPGTVTVTYAKRGVFEEEGKVQEFFQMLKRN